MTTGRAQPAEELIAAPIPVPARSERAPASNEVVEIVPGVLRMQLPAPLPGIGHVNMYGLMDRRGLAVVDPGLPGPTAWKAIETRLRAAGYAVRDVHTIVVTHSHIDHYGAAGQLAKRAGATLLAHDAFTTPMHEWLPVRVTTRFAAARAERDVETLTRVIDRVEANEESPSAFAGPGARELQRCQHPSLVRTPWGARRDARSARRLLRLRLTTLLSSLPRPSRRVRHGQRLEVGGREWAFVHTPGHTVDHLCLYDRDAGVVLSGDHVLPSISPHVQGVPGGHDVLGAYLDALALVGSLDGVQLGLPAHGDPIPDITARVASVRRHQARRSERVLAATRALGTGTVLEIGRALFVRHHKGLASDAEAYVHLEHLCATGAVERVQGSGPARYRATSG